MDIKPGGIQFYEFIIKGGSERNSFDIINQSGETLETVGIFPGTPELCNPGFAYVAIGLDVFKGGARAKKVVSADTFDEAEWVAYGLTKKIAERLNEGNLLGILDMTGRRKEENPYQEETNVAYQVIKGA